jgi:hypothetical protein
MELGCVAQVNRTSPSQISPDPSLKTNMALRAICIIVLALLPSLADAQLNLGERQRTSQQEAQRHGCREGATIVYGTQRDKSREVMPRSVQDCMQRHR